MAREDKGKEPMYEVEDIDKAMALWETVDYHTSFSVKSLSIEYFNAGHILGSASVKVSSPKASVLFSGDLGNVPVPLIRGTYYPQAADYILVESAYGNRVHEPIAERKGLLENLIEETVQAGGVLMVPAFAMERTQQLLYELNELVEHGRIPEVPIFIDSPLAIKLTSIYQKYSQDPDFFEAKTIKTIQAGDEIFNFPNLGFTLTTDESKGINDVPAPKVIIAGSGMSQGGRILFHESRYLPDPNSTILFVGFQSEGSLGRRIIDGEKKVKIMGTRVSVAARVEAIGGFSAHADQPLLLKWIEGMKGSAKKVFVVQGELDQAIPLSAKIRDELAVDAVVPDPGETVDLA